MAHDPISATKKLTLIELTTHRFEPKSLKGAAVMVTTLETLGPLAKRRQWYSFHVMDVAKCSKRAKSIVTPIGVEIVIASAVSIAAYLSMEVSAAAFCQTFGPRYLGSGD